MQACCLHASLPVPPFCVGVAPHRLHDEPVGRLGRGCVGPACPDGACAIVANQLHFCGIVQNDVAIGLHDELHCPISRAQGCALHAHHAHTHVPKALDSRGYTNAVEQLRIGQTCGSVCPDRSVPFMMAASAFASDTLALGSTWNDPKCMS